MKNRLNRYWKEFSEIVKTREMSILPAHLAYYFILATIPALTLIFFIATLFNLPVDIISNFLTNVFSNNIKNILIEIINGTSLNIRNVFIFLIALFITSNGAKSIIIASNTVFNIPNNNVFRRRIKSFVITIILIILITFILLVPLFGNTILTLFGKIGIETEVTTVLNLVFPVLKWPLTLFIVFIFIKLLYTIAPDEKIPFSYVNKGSIFTTILWSIITMGYSFYINNFAAYDKLYGALSTIVILMLWFWLLSYILVIGLALNYRNMENEIEKTNTLKLKEIQDKVRQNKNNNVY